MSEGPSQLRQTRVLIAAMVAAAVSLFVALMAWGASSAPGSSPDEDYHLVSIWCANGAVFDCTPQADGSRLIPVGLASWCYLTLPDVSAACVPRGPLPLDEQPLVSSARFDQGEYPPVFYATLGMLAGNNVESSVLRMRVFNAALFVAMAGAVVALAPRLIRPPVLVGIVAILVPLAAFLIPSANPSSWAVASAAVLWAAIAASLRSDGWRRWTLAGLAVLAGAVGSGARADAAAFSVLAVVIGVLLGVKGRPRPSDFLAPVTVVVMAGFSFLSTSQGQVSATGLDGEMKLSRTGIRMAVESVPSLWQGMFGGWPLGWDTGMAPAVPVLTFAIAAGLVLWGLGRWDWRKLVAVGGAFGALYAVPVYVLAVSGLVVGQLIQPRYLLPLGVVLIGVAASAGRGVLPRLSVPQSVVIAVTLALANSLSLHTNIRRYISGSDLRMLDLDRAVEWWWSAGVPRPMVVWSVGTVAMAVFFASAMFLVHVWSQEPDEDAAGVAPRRSADEAPAA